MTEWNFYLWTRLDAIAETGETIGLVGGMALIVLIAYKTLAFFYNKEVKMFTKDNALIMCFALLFFALSIMIPTSEEYAVMKIMPKMTELDANKEIPPQMENLYKAAKEYFDTLNHESPELLEEK